MTMTIQLSNDMSARLAALAARTGRSESDLATEAVIEHIDELEEIYLAEYRSNGFRAGCNTED